MAGFKPLEHQLIAAEQALKILKTLGYVYINGQPRSGKTLTSILIAEQCKADRVLVLTKKAAIPGWDKFLDGSQKHVYVVTNYEQASKVIGKFNLVIIDESHNLGAYPKPSLRFKTIRALCWHIPHIHLSGTPVIESACSIYHQMAISIYNPFRQYTNFYSFFKEYGILETMYLRGILVKKYDKFKPKLLDEIAKFTVYMSQEDAGIKTKVSDKIHYVELGAECKKLYNAIVKDEVAYYNGLEIICDSPMKLRTTLHQVEGSVLKIGEEYYDLGYHDKLKYILDNFGDTEDTGIMCHFIGEQKLLAKHFKRARIYSSNAHAEGVDLSHLKNFIIYSSDYSGAKFVQRRDRIVNINGSNTTTVHHILVKGAISDQVYYYVSKKLDFNNSVFVPGGYI